MVVEYVWASITACTQNINVLEKQEHIELIIQWPNSDRDRPKSNIQAYFPLRRKTTGIGALRWVTPPTQRFCVTYTNMLVSKNAKFCVTPNTNFTQNPKASHWNIGCVGYQTQNFRVGHVHFMFFVLISFAFGGQRKPSFQWNMGLRMVCLESWVKRLRLS